MTCRYCTMSEHRSGKLSWLQGPVRHDAESADTAYIEVSDDGGFVLVAEHVEPFDDMLPATVETSTTIERCPWCGDVPSRGEWPRTDPRDAALALSEWIERNENVLDNLDEGAGFLHAEVLAHILPQEASRPMTHDEMLASADDDGIAEIRGIVRMSLDELFGGIEAFDEVVSERLTGTCNLQSRSYEAVGAAGGDVLVDVRGYIDTTSL